MPPRSKAQARLMRAVAVGSVNIPGLSQSEAREYVGGYSTKKLPIRVVKRGKRKRVTRR